MARSSAGQPQGSQAGACLPDWMPEGTWFVQGQRQPLGQLLARRSSSARARRQGSSTALQNESRIVPERRSGPRATNKAARRMSAAAAVRRPWQHICTAPPTGHVVFTCETSRQQHETAQVFMPALLLPRIPATHTRHFSATALWSRLFTLHLPPAMPKRSTCQ